MGLIDEIRSRARHVIGPTLAVCVVGYFAYHAVQGERGLIAMRQLGLQIERARQIQAHTAARRQTLEHRVHLLNRSGLDPDLLDEQARLMLNYGHRDETVIFIAPGTRR